MLGEKLREFQGKVTGQRILPAAASMLGLALVLSLIANVQAAELQILAGGGMASPLKELGAQFESASGHKLVFRFGTTPELIKDRKSTRLNSSHQIISYAVFCLLK